MSRIDTAFRLLFGFLALIALVFAIGLLFKGRSEESLHVSILCLLLCIKMDCMRNK